MDFDAKNKFLVAFLLFSWFAAPLAAQPSAPRWNLAPAPHAGLVVRVKTLVEVAGSLHAASKPGVASLPLKVDAELFFDEQGLAGDDFPSARHYWKAEAQLTVNGEETNRQLRDDRRLIRLRGNSVRDRIFSPLGPLTREELELLDVAGSGFPPEQLLPEKSVAIGESWSHEEELVARLLRVQEVQRGELHSTLQEVVDEVAKLKLQGEVDVVADGVSATIEVVGNYQFDLPTKTVSWFALSLQEHREASFAAPAFEAVSQIRTARKKVAQSTALRSQVLQNVGVTPAVGDRLLDYVSSDERYRLIYNRRWYVIKQQEASTVMRLVDEGDLIATCKIDRLNRMAPGHEMTLFGFQKDVRRALDRFCDEIVTAGETVSPQGVRILRVEAAGKAEETPVRWVYYHLANEQGQRLSLIFTYEASMAERFAGVDESLTSSVQFLGQPVEEARHPTGPTR